MMRAPRPYDGILDLYIGWLNSNRPEEFVPAVEYLCRAGPDVTPFLIEAAAKPGTPTVHQFRLLSLASKIGGRRGPDENHYLRTLRRHGCPAIRQKAEELFAILTPRRQSRKSGSGRLLRTLATLHKLAAARTDRQGTSGGRHGRPKSVPAGRKPVAPGIRLPTS